MRTRIRSARHRFTPSTYAYNPNGSRTQMVDDRPGTANDRTTTVDPPAGQDPERVTRTAYYPSGARERRTKERNGVEETYFYNSDGALARQRRRRPPSESFLKDQSYRYDANANRTSDERGEHSFNSRDQLTRWDKPGPGQVDYTLNGSGAITKEAETEAGGAEVVTSYDYTGDRLNSTSRGDATTSYDYDDFGAVSEIKVEAGQ